MGMTERDRKVLIAVVVGLVVLIYWFMLLGPKRAALTEAQTSRDQAIATLETARSQVVQGQQEKKTFKTSYARVVKLGKALPADDDVASLIVQVSKLADQDKVDFNTLTVAEGGEAPVLPKEGATGATGGTTPPASAVGAAKQRAETGRDTASADANRAASSTAEAAAPEPVPTGTDLAAAASGLEVVTFQLNFSGNFFDLHSFFKRINNLVVRTERNVRVTGRLLQVTSMDLQSETFPKLTATVQMSGYKLPKGASPTAGATPGGVPQPDAAPAAAPGAPATPPAATATGVGR